MSNVIGKYSDFITVDDEQVFVADPGRRKRLRWKNGRMKMRPVQTTGREVRVSQIPKSVAVPTGPTLREAIKDADGAEDMVDRLKRQGFRGHKIKSALAKIRKAEVAIMKSIAQIVPDTLIVGGVE